MSGKAVMYLYRHPRETKENKSISGRIIHNWARPIFHKEDNFAKLSKVSRQSCPGGRSNALTVLQEERREKDEAVILRMSGSRKRKVNAEEAVTRPGDPGWVGRARVPQVEQGEYVRRPDWQTSATVSDTRKKGVKSRVTSLTQVA